MEQGVFLKPPVGPILKQHFVEARLHTDGDAHIDRILDLQAEYVGDIGLPSYLSGDPEPLRKPGRFSGIARNDGEVREFVDFLNQGLRAVRGESLPAPP